MPENLRNCLQYGETSHEHQRQQLSSMSTIDELHIASPTAIFDETLKRCTLQLSANGIIISRVHIKDGGQ